MELNNDLITQFAKITKFNTGKSATTVRGTIRKADDENARPYLVIDGAEEDSKTPVDTVVEVADGDRVIATVKDHSVIVTGNKTNPAIGKKTADGLRSEITQTASEIRAEVADDISGLNSTITQTATMINQRIDNLNAIDGSEFTDFKQTVEGFYFTDEDGTVYIDGGSVYAKNLNLTGAITWSDLDEDAKDEIDDAVSDAVKKLDMPELPTYIKDTYIDSTTIESPTIIGGQLYAVGSDPENESTFTTMDENGFYLYSNTVIADVDNEIYPKISMVCGSTANARPMIVLGSGESDDYKYHNRFVIEKGTSYVDMLYIFNYSYTTTGFTFNRDGTIDVQGELRGIDGLFPIGYIYLSYNHTSPASLFGGTWTRLSPYFLYAAGSSATIGETGYVNVSGTAAQYIKISAWRRTG